MCSNKRFISVILAMSFLLTMSLPVVTLSQESQADKPNVLRQASLEWMQVGINQYQSQQFAEAEKSFRRALVFKKYLTEAERLKINKYLTKARVDLSEGKQPAASVQPAKAEEKVKSSEPLAVKEQPQTEKEPKIVSSQIEQEDQSVKQAEPAVPENDLAAETSSDVVVVKDKSFGSEFMRLSAWLSANRRNVLLIGLPVLGVLIIIMKLQRIRIRPGRRVYANYVPVNSSFIGARLNGGGESGHAASAAFAKPKRKSFSQTTEHWKKNAVESPAEHKEVEKKEKWPKQKDKTGPGDSAIAKAGQKQCRKCKQSKPHSDFYKNRSSKDGLASWCKQCMKEYSKKRAAQKK